MQTVSRGGRPSVPIKLDRAQFMLRPDLFERIKGLASSEHRSVSNMLSILVERGLLAYVEQADPETVAV